MVTIVLNKKYLDRGQNIRTVKTKNAVSGCQENQVLKHGIFLVLITMKALKYKRIHFLFLELQVQWIWLLFIPVHFMAA